LDRETAQFDVRREDGVAILSISGELDLSNVEEYELAQGEAIGTGLPVVMDFGGCEFIDSRGLQGIIETFNLATELGQPFALAGSGPQVRRVFDLTNMANLLPYFPGVEDAVQHVKQ